MAKTWLLALLVVWGCGASEPAPQLIMDQRDVSADDEDAHVNVPAARKLIAAAQKAFEVDKDLAAARGKLREAERFANSSVQEEIRKWNQRIDRYQAEQIVPPIVAEAKKGKCIETADATLKVVAQHRGKTVARFVKDRVSPALLACLLGVLDVDISIGREMLADARVKRALDVQSYQKLQSKVSSVTVNAVIERLREPIDKRDWRKVRKDVDDLLARKEVGETDYDRISTLIRKGVSEDVVAKVDKALGRSLGAALVLKEIDRLIEAARWGTGQDGSVREVPVPPMVARRRAELALWVACGSLSCKLSSTAERWAYGEVGLRPMLNPRGKVLRKFKHATKLWLIADSLSSVLVAVKDPGELEGVGARIPVAAGWVKRSSLRSQDTAEWLPPGAAIVGTRIWAPLRPRSSLELGTVTAVVGGKLEVERLADRVKVKVARRKVHFGTIKVGTKVYAHCEHPVRSEPARIDMVVQTGGDPVAKLSCLNDAGEPKGLKRQAQLGSLRTKAQWLPPRR